jgi:hypothetical protein
MVRYLFTEIGFPPTGNGRQTGTKIMKSYVRKEKNTKTQNIQNRKQTYKTRKQT